jgi:hypothetical protein
MADVPYDRVKHLELISKAIERMDKASYALKALSPAALGVALVLIDRRVPAWLALGAAAIAIFIYWWLDASYLGRERSFRRLYNRVRKGELDDDPYVMEIGDVFGKASVWSCMRAGVTMFVHGAVLLLTVIAAVALELRPQNGPMGFF